MKEPIIIVDKFSKYFVVSMVDDKNSLNLKYHFNEKFLSGNAAQIYAEQKSKEYKCPIINKDWTQEARERQ